MFELYLLTRLGLIHGLFIAAVIVCFISAIACFIITVTTDDWTGEDVCNDWQKSKLRKFARNLLYIGCFSLIITILTPTKEETYLIYGVGGSIDYLKTNPTAKRLPDKCIQALDKWVDKLNEKEDGSN